MRSTLRPALSAVLLALVLATVPAPPPAAATSVYDLRAACPDGVGEVAPFLDVAGVHAPGIACLARAGIVEGRTVTRFAPGDVVTRGQAASLLLRLHDLALTATVSATGSVRFRDIASSVHRASIERLTQVAPAVLSGFDDGTFRPAEPVSRAQLATLVVRLLDHIAARQPSFAAPGPATAQRFRDVAAGSTHDDAVHRLAGVGVLRGRNAEEFAPTAPLTRAQAATTLARVLGGLADAGLVAPVPAASAAPVRWRPAPGTTWHWQLQGTVDPSLDVAVFGVDGEDTSTAEVAALRAGGRAAICYLSAGSWEEWRADADRFPAEVLGSSNGWPGERWLDVRRLDVLGPIMADRMATCAEKGFDAVEPDNIDGAFNDTGFPLTRADQLTYNRWLARTAHALGLSIGLKNTVEQAAELEPWFDFAVNESCMRWQECEELDVFIDAGKAVFHVEYDLPVEEFCPRAQALGFSSMRKRLSVDAWAEPCWR